MTAKKAPPPDKDDPVKVSGILDEVSRGIIFQGVSVPQLRAIFNLKDEDVMRRLGDLPPVGTGRQNNPVYNLAQAAARIDFQGIALRRNEVTPVSAAPRLIR